MKFNNKKFKKGFTLIELLVTITIFVILTGVVLFSSSGFNNTILLKNLAYDVALTIKQAQSYGVNVNESQSTANPFAPFGVYFNINNPPNGSIKNFVFFNDTSGGTNNTSNGKYDGYVTVPCQPTGTECISEYTIGNGNYISGICVSQGSSCSQTNSINDLTILFTRPNPNAKITATDNSGITSTFNYADIQVSSANGTAKKDIIVTAIGQIYVQ